MNDDHIPMNCLSVVSSMFPFGKNLLDLAVFLNRFRIFDVAGRQAFEAFHCFHEQHLAVI